MLRVAYTGRRKGLGMDMDTLIANTLTVGAGSFALVLLLALVGAVAGRLDRRQAKAGAGRHRAGPGRPAYRVSA